MGRYWKRWVGLVVFAAVLVTTFVQLGLWQLRRLDQRRERNAVVVAQQQAPVATESEVLADPVTSDERFRRVTLEGTFDADHQLQVRARTANGSQGWEAVVPLHTTEGRWVLVDRGFVARELGEGLPAPDTVAAPPAGTVRVEGYVMVAERGTPASVTPAEGSVRLIDPAAIAAWSGLPLVDGYVSVTATTPAQGGGFTPVPLPPLDEGPHMSYAVQWFSFATIGTVGTFILIGRDIVEIRTRRSAGTGRPAEQPAS